MAGDQSDDGRFSRCYTLHPESPSGSSFLKKMSLPGAIVCEPATKESAIAVGATIGQQLLNTFNSNAKFTATDTRDWRTRLGSVTIRSWLGITILKIIITS
jgi:hypothetical protein